MFNLIGHTLPNDPQNPSDNYDGVTYFDGDVKVVEESNDIEGRKKGILVKSSYNTMGRTSPCGSTEGASTENIWQKVVVKEIYIKTTCNIRIELDNEQLCSVGIYWLIPFPLLRHFGEYDPNILGNKYVKTPFGNFRAVVMSKELHEKYIKEKENGVRIIWNDNNVEIKKLSISELKDYENKFKKYNNIYLRHDNYVYDYDE